MEERRAKAKSSRIYDGNCDAKLAHTRTQGELGLLASDVNSVCRVHNEPRDAKANRAEPSRAEGIAPTLHFTCEPSQAECRRGIPLFPLKRRTTTIRSFVIRSVIYPRASKADDSIPLQRAYPQCAQASISLV